jgi:hypothetical protein
MVQNPDKSDKTTEQRTPGPLSPRRTAELAGRSPGNQSKGYSREGSDGTPSMGSSYSDLDGKLPCYPQPAWCSLLTTQS